jgi:hypothetical protein
MEVVSAVAWSEANRCLATKEEFDLTHEGHCLRQGIGFSATARSFPPLRLHSSVAPQNEIMLSIFSHCLWIAAVTISYR